MITPDASFAMTTVRNDGGLRNDGIASKQGILLPTSRDQDDGMENDHHLPEGLKVTWRKIVWPIGTSFTDSIAFVSGL